MSAPQNGSGNLSRIRKKPQFKKPRNPNEKITTSSISCEKFGLFLKLAEHAKNRIAEKQKRREQLLQAIQKMEEKIAQLRKQKTEIVRVFPTFKPDNSDYSMNQSIWDF